MRLSVLLAPLAFLLVNSLSAQTYGVAVTPDGQVVSNKTAHTTGHTQVFRITNEGTAAQTFTITCVGASNVTCLSTSDTVELINGNSFKNFTATGPQSTGQGSITVPVVLSPGWPRIDPLPYLDAKQDYTRCAAGCFAATYAHSTVPFFSLDAARNVTLVYHGDRLAPNRDLFSLPSRRPPPRATTSPSNGGSASTISARSTSTTPTPTRSMAAGSSSIPWAGYGWPRMCSAIPKPCRAGVPIPTSA